METHVRVGGAPRPEDALAWLDEGEGGALAFLVTRAKGCAVRVEAAPDAQARLEGAAARVATGSGATRVLVWQATGLIGERAPVAVLGALAPRRADAFRAVDGLVAALKGIASREDVPRS